MRFYGSADGRKLTIRDQSENRFKINRRDEELRIKRRLIYTCVGKMDFFRKRLTNYFEDFIVETQISRIVTGNRQDQYLMRFLHLLLIFFYVRNERGCFLMQDHYVITKLINNNVVFSTDAGGREIIVFGKAVGFGKKRGDSIDNSKIIKVFEPSDTKEKNFLMNLVEDIDPVYIDMATKIIALFESRLHCKVNVMMNISLSDHIHNAVRNKQEGFQVPLDILEEVKTMYPREFLIAKEGLDLIEKETRTTLGEDEAGYIVLHYINAQGQHFRSDAKVRLLFQERVIQEIEREYGVKLDHLSVYYSRFLTHLSFLAARLHDGQLLEASQSTLYPLLVQKYPRLEACTELIAGIILNEFHMPVGEEEKGYLALHIHNLLKNLKMEESSDGTTFK